MGGILPAVAAVRIPPQDKSSAVAARRRRRRRGRCLRAAAAATARGWSAAESSWRRSWAGTSCLVSRRRRPSCGPRCCSASSPLSDKARRFRWPPSRGQPTSAQEQRWAAEASTQSPWPAAAAAAAPAAAPPALPPPPDSSSSPAQPSARRRRGRRRC